jgi:hypothetical protein
VEEGLDTGDHAGAVGGGERGGGNTRQRVGTGSSPMTIAAAAVATYVARTAAPSNPPRRHTPQHAPFPLPDLFCYFQSILIGGD